MNKEKEVYTQTESGLFDDLDGKELLFSMTIESSTEKCCEVNSPLYTMTDQEYVN